MANGIGRRELIDLYTPTEAELELAASAAKGEAARLSFLVLLKTSQRLGYFVALEEVPRCIVEHIGLDRGMLIVGSFFNKQFGSGQRHSACSTRYHRNHAIKLSHNQEGPRNCTKLVSVLEKPIPKPTLSQHMRVLRQAGLIRGERHGHEMRNTSRYVEVDARYPGCC